LDAICREELYQPGALELIAEAERHIIVKPDTKVLSVGCGSGELECYFAAKFNCTVHGIDNAADSIRHASEKAVKKSIADRTRFSVCDGRATNFSINAFDLVLCSGGWAGDLVQLGRFVQESHRILKTDGKVVLITTVWTREDVPDQVKNMWAKGGAIFHPSEVEGFFQNHQFGVEFSRIADEPIWWQNWCNDMQMTKAYSLNSTDPSIWKNIHRQYHESRGCIGLGLFILRRL